MANLEKRAIFASNRKVLALKNTRRKNPSFIPSILSISMVLLMLGLFLLLAFSANKMKDYLKENVTLTAYLHLDAHEQQVKELVQELELNKSIKSVKWTTSEEAANEMKVDLGQDFIQTLGYNPLGGDLEVKFHSDQANQQNLAATKKWLSDQALVKDATYQSSQLDQIEANSQKLLGGIAILGVLFTIIAITLINSTIRLDLYSKRFIIRSMQLVGARRWFIIRPFIGKSIMHGIYGFVISGLILSGVLYLLSTYIPDPQSLVSYVELGIIAGIILGAGILLTFVCSWFATRKYLRLKLEELY
ncbi:MAG: FtsX-like permease family protein [Bacteroidetes bacterium]|nr:MAG: FtsX-like permease family protein [Bacteroidota bacterium]